MATRSPPPTSTAATQAYFLGIELANEQLRGAIVDEHLGIIGVEVVDFDSELPEYQFVFFSISGGRVSFLTQGDYHSRTRAGLFNAPGDTFTTPIEMWIRGLGELILLLCHTRSSHC